MANEDMEEQEEKDEEHGSGDSGISEENLFSEYNEAKDCIDILTTITTPTAIIASNSSISGDDNNNNNNNGGNGSHTSDNNNKEKVTLQDNNNNNNNKTKALIRLRNIYDKYLQCPTLLDRFMEPMMNQLTTCARDIIHNNNSDGSNITLPYVLSAIYSLSKVRGRKSIQRFFPHNVPDVQPVFSTLCHLSTQQQLENTQQQQQQQDQPQAWESIYVLWIWMGMLSYVPFDCSVIVDESSFIASFMELSKQQHLANTGPIRDVAANAVSLWLCRPDLEQTQLPLFVSWSCENIVATQQSKSNTNVFLLLGILQTLVSILKVSTGNRETLVKLLLPLWEPMIQFVESKTSLCHHNLLLRKLMVKWWSRMGCAFLSPTIPKWRYQRGRRILLLLDYSDDSHSEENNDHNNNKSNNTSNNNNEGQQQQKPEEEEEDASNNDDDNDVLDNNVLHQVEDAMGYIMESLNDTSTIVRYSAAKGIGRVTERLPCICSHDVIDAILELFWDEEKDQAWHGACLALAELARRGLLLPNRLQDIVPYIIRAIHYEKRRGASSSASSGSSIGAHVRDAACYTYWAFARAYAPAILKPYLQSLSESIIVTFLFDREINCRRAANAAFQEFVGRQGSENFKHGITILTTADYFSLGNRKDSYISVAYKIAKIAIEYRRPIIDELYTNKLYHWDVNIRILASKSLHELALLDVPYICEVVLPLLLRNCLDDKNLFVRHGSILGTAEIILALGSSETGTTTTTTPSQDYENNNRNKGELQEPKDYNLKTPIISVETTFLEHLTKETMASLVELVPNIEKKRLYRGRGGEIIRSAICRFICCLSRVNIPLNVKQQVGLLDTIDSNIPHPNEKIQENACDALYQLMRTYFPVMNPITKGPTDRLQKRVVDKYIDIIYTKNDNPAMTRGFTLALGSLPAKLLAPIPKPIVLENVLRCLCKSSLLLNGNNNNNATTPTDMDDPETRRNALIALKKVCETVGVGDNASGSSKNGAIPCSSREIEDSASAAPSTRTTIGLNNNQVTQVFDTFFLALQDYSIDRRGDVGSWARIAAMDGLVSLSFLTATAINNDSDNTNTTNSTDDDNNTIDSYFNQSVCIRVIGALCKQLAEKLDAVREHAGKCLEKLVMSNHDTIVQYIPQRQYLLECLGGLSLNTGNSITTTAIVATTSTSSVANDTEPKSVDWSDGAVTFPIVMNAASIDNFFPDIIAGIVISVGGLTESVSEHATEALLHWAKSNIHNVKESHNKIKDLGDVLLQLFKAHSRKSRVINPLLKTVDTLLTHQCFEEIILCNESDGITTIDNSEKENLSSSSCFSESLLLRLLTEEKNCSDVHRLFSIVDVALSSLSALLGSSSNGKILDKNNFEMTKTRVVDNTLIFVCTMLCHRFPRVRRYTAENFYVALLEHSNFVNTIIVSGDDGNDSKTDEVLNLLLNSPWDADLNTTQTIEIVDRVAQLLGISLANYATTNV